MAIRDHINRVPKQSGKVITVDLTGSSPVIEVLRLDGAVIRVAVNDYPASFRWPKEGEVWSMTEENGVWILGGRIEDPSDTLKALELQPGEALIRGDTVWVEGGIRRNSDGLVAAFIPPIRPVVTGYKANNNALASLIAALTQLGLIYDATT